MQLAQVQTMEARRLLAVVLDDSYGDNGFVPGGKVFQAIGRRADGTARFSANFSTGGGHDGDGNRKRAAIDLLNQDYGFEAIETALSD